jgi:hypothetical protein
LKVERTLSVIKTHLDIESFDFMNKERATIWDKSDWRNIKKVYSTLKQQNKYINKMYRVLKRKDLTSRDKDSAEFILGHHQRQFRAFLGWYEGNLDRRWNDQTCYWFDTHEKFEPQQVTIIKNKLTAQGLARSALYMTGQASDYPRWIAIGRGTTKVEADQKALVDEVFRNPVDYYVANGNIISSGTLFPDGIITGDFREFGGMTSPTSDDSRQIWRSVIENSAKRLQHTLGQDRPASAHMLYLTSK